jgi:hypothetical protein
MFFVDDPYVSDFFKKTVLENALPVVNTPGAQKYSFLPGTRLISEADAIQALRQDKAPLLYATSENTIGWIAQHLDFTGIPAQIEFFKDKAKFRRVTQSIFPSLYFKEVPLNELAQVRVEELPLPFVIKPSVGFFSLGVHKVNSAAEWPGTIAAIQQEIDQITGMYPDEVLNIRSFIIEGCIDGDEFAIDAYYNNEGQAVILDILHHTFSSAADVSDRIYTTSKEIIEGNLVEFTDFLNKIGSVTGVKRFPVHVELRRDRSGLLLPIEVNPMRFGGWCSTPDLAYTAYGLNPYLYYQNQQKPDWNQLLAGKDNLLYSVVILDNSTGKTADEIASFDYEKLLASFEHPLELRKIDYHVHPLFAFLYVETRAENTSELDAILHSKLNEFITLK